MALQLIQNAVLVDSAQALECREPAIATAIALQDEPAQAKVRYAIVRD
jgi:hypothetical protein